MVTALVVLISARLAFQKFRNEIMGDLKKRWDGGEMFETRKRVLGQGSKDLKRTVEKAYKARNAGKDSSGDWIIIMRLPNFYEDLGLKVKRQHVSLRSVDDWFGDAIVGEWRRWEDAIKWLRKESKQPSGAEAFQKLAQRLVELRKKLEQAKERRDRANAR